MGLAFSTSSDVQYEALRAAASPAVLPALEAARAAPEPALHDLVAHGYEPSGDGNTADGRLEHVHRQAFVRVLMPIDEGLRRRALNLDSGYIQALVDGIVNAPQQDVSALAQLAACCGTIKPHALDAVMALSDATHMLIEDSTQILSAPDRDAALDYIASAVTRIVDRFWTDRDLMRNVVRSSHHAEEYIMPYNALIAGFSKLDRIKPSLLHACPRLLNVLLRMVVDLDETAPALAAAGRGLYGLLLKLWIEAQTGSQALGVQRFDLFPLIEDPDSLVLAIGRHLANPTLVGEAAMIMSLTLNHGGPATIQCFASPDLGLAIALSRHIDTIVAAPVPIPGASFFGSAMSALKHCLTDQPYVLAKVLAEDDALVKLARAGVANSATSPVPTAGLIEIIKAGIESSPELRRKHRQQIDKATSIALGGLPDVEPSIGVRQAWIKLAAETSS